MKTLKYYLEKAQKQKWAIGQFNFSTASQLKGIVGAAKNLQAPVIIGTSENESKFFGLKQAVFYRDLLRKETGVPIFLNLDHGKSFEYLKEAIDEGYDMVHFDGSKLSLEENIKISQKIVKYAKKKGVLVEGEFGQIGNDASKVYWEKFKINDANLTNPEQALEYVKKSKVDLLAVSIGTFHGIEASGINPNLRIDLLKEIKKEVGDIPLVLHGGSGTPREDIVEAIKLGIAKININTELRLAYTGTIIRMLKDNPDETTPYKYLPEATKKVQSVVEEKIKLFGSENKV
jgi:fructose-bisphosphate aldolase class II